MFESPWLKHVANAVRWRAEFRRRTLSKTLLIDFLPLDDSHLDLGEEQIMPNEPDLIDRTIEVLAAKQRKNYPPGMRPMPRDFHAKTQGCIAAKFTVLGDLPADVRHGVFARPRTFDAVVRFSNGQRLVGSDRLPDIRGLAIKVALDDGAHQDFLLANFPVNLLDNVEESYHFYRAEAADKPVSYMLWHLRVFAVGWLGSLGATTHDVLSIDYFSQTPYRLGPGRACKYIAKPERRLPYDGVPVPQRPDYLRERMAERLLEKRETIRFDFFVQRQLHPLRQPVEHASFEWSETESVPVKVAQIELTPCPNLSFLSPEHMWHAERLSFNPATALPEHTPLGGINRLRIRAYEMSAKMRRDANRATPPDEVLPPCPRNGGGP